MLNQWPRLWQKPLKDEPFTFRLYVLPTSHCSLGLCTFLSAERFTSVLLTRRSKGVCERLKLSKDTKYPPVSAVLPPLMLYS